MINVSLNDETHTYTVIRNGDLIAIFPDGGATYVAKVINALVVHPPHGVSVHLFGPYEECGLYDCANFRRGLWAIRECG